jgi:chaperonin GroEL
MSYYKLILNGSEARLALKNGSDILAKAVIGTLGPKSRNVGLNRQYPGPQIIHDGVKIAQEIRLKNPFEDMGASYVYDAAKKTNDLAGDGTTTATLLANKIIQDGFNLIEGGLVDGVMTGKVNAMELRDYLQSYAEIVCDRLTKRAKAIKETDRKEIEQIAYVSSGDKAIGQLVCDAYEKVGREGVIMVEDSAGYESSLSTHEGMEFENGYLSAFFQTNPDKEICEYQDGYVLLTDYTISDAMQLVPIVEKVIKDNNKPLLIIANDVVGVALKALIQTKVRLSAKLVAVVAPEFADRRIEMLKDIAILTGGILVSKDLGKQLVDVELSDLGRFSSIKVSATHTAISPKDPDAEEIEQRVNAIKDQLRETTNDFKKQRLEYRLGRLSQKVAIINIGGVTNSDISEKRERAVDAIGAVKSAMAEGIIPGGGTTLYEIADELEEEWMEKNLEGDALQASALTLNTLRAPFETILTNAGLNVQKTLDLINLLPDTVKNRGYDIVAKRAGDLMHLGVVDPVRVTRLAVYNAFHIASQLLTTESLISDDIEEDNKKV